MDKVDKEYSCATKELNNYLNTVINRRKRKNVHKSKTIELD